MSTPKLKLKFCLFFFRERFFFLSFFLVQPFQSSYRRVEGGRSVRYLDAEDGESAMEGADGARHDSHLAETNLKPRGGESSHGRLVISTWDGHTAAAETGTISTCVVRVIKALDCGSGQYVVKEGVSGRRVRCAGAKRCTLHALVPLAPADLYNTPMPCPAHAYAHLGSDVHLSSLFLAFFRMT